MSGSRYCTTLSTKGTDGHAASTSSIEDLTNPAGALYVLLLTSKAPDLLYEDMKDTLKLKVSFHFHCPSQAESLFLIEKYRFTSLDKSI
jgi:hypothetical protein